MIKISDRRRIGGSYPHRVAWRNFYLAKVSADEHSAEYIQLYNGDVEVLAKSLDHIQKTAARILEGIQAHQVPETDEVTA